MSSDEARAEAERRWPQLRLSDRFPIDWLNEGMSSGFVIGAAWQAERDAVRIAELEAEVEQWRRVAVEQTRLERDRAEAAAAKLDAVRALHQRSTVLTNLDDMPYCRHCIAPWPCATVRAIEEDET